MLTSTPASRAMSAASESEISTSCLGLIAHCMSAGALRLSSRSRASDTGAYALTSSSLAPTAFAMSTASRTAWVAVSEPSVPTTIELNMLPPSGDWSKAGPATGGAIIAASRAWQFAAASPMSNGARHRLDFRS